MRELLILTTSLRELLILYVTTHLFGFLIPKSADKPKPQQTTPEAPGQAEDQCELQEEPATSTRRVGATASSAGHAEQLEELTARNAALEAELAQLLADKSAEWTHSRPPIDTLGSGGGQDAAQVSHS